MRKRRLPVLPSELDTKGDRLADKNWPFVEGPLLGDRLREAEIAACAAGERPWSGLRCRFAGYIGRRMQIFCSGAG